MFKIINFIKKNKTVLVILIILFSLFGGMWYVVSGGYDKQNKTILFFKKFIPSKISRKIRDTIFIIPDLKERNKFLSTQVRKHDQGLDGELFKENLILSKNKKQEYVLKEFFLPFPRLDVRLGWAGKKNSTAAHHLAIIKDKVLVISGDGQTIYFNKKNILTKKLNQINIPNNIEDILVQNNFELIGIRDLFVEDKIVYISLIHQSSKGISINVYNADLSFKKLNFKIFFKNKSYWPTYNVYSGGRLAKYKDNKILFSIGHAAVNGAAQDMNSLLGKVISIDKSTKEVDIISMGHRNPQGLVYVEDSDIIINTEHGPKGGDEININFQSDNKDSIPNFGWDIASYGIEYDGSDPYKKSHSKYGFDEPFKYYVPSIGISQLVYLPTDLNFNSEKHLFVSSLRAASVYVIKINDKFNKIIEEDRIYLDQQRIRDIVYDEENNVFFLILELMPSIGILKLK